MRLIPEGVPALLPHVPNKRRRLRCTDFAALCEHVAPGPASALGLAAGASADARGECRCLGLGTELGRRLCSGLDAPLPEGAVVVATLAPPDTPLCVESLGASGVLQWAPRRVLHMSWDVVAVVCLGTQSVLGAQAPQDSYVVSDLVPPRLPCT